MWEAKTEYLFERERERERGDKEDKNKSIWICLWHQSCITSKDRLLMGSTHHHPHVKGGLDVLTAEF